MAIGILFLYLLSKYTHKITSVLDSFDREYGPFMSYVVCTFDLGQCCVVNGYLDIF